MTTEPLELGYTLDLLAPGRFPFRRWRWELWHGPRLLAAGWRVNALHAQRAIGTHALRYAHRRLGVHLLRGDAGEAAEKPWLGRAVELGAAAVRVRLVPMTPTERPGRLRTVAT
jgi:hypothetical protein